MHYGTSNKKGGQESKEKANVSQRRKKKRQEAKDIPHFPKAPSMTSPVRICFGICVLSCGEHQTRIEGRLFSSWQETETHRDTMTGRLGHKGLNVRRGRQ